MSPIDLEEHGLTVEDIRQLAVGWLTELGEEYGDDGKLSTKEIVRSVAHLLEAIGEELESDVGEKLESAGKILGLVARFMPGPD